MEKHRFRYYLLHALDGHQLADAAEGRSFGAGIGKYQAHVLSIIINELIFSTKGFNEYYTFKSCIVLQ